MTVLNIILNVLKDFGSTFLRGKFTYLVSSIAIVGAVAMLVMNQIDNETFLFLVNANLAILGIRRAIDK